MGASTKITVAFHKPVFSRVEVAEYFDLGVRSRKLSSRMEWQEVNGIEADFRVARRKLHLQDITYLLWVVSPEFYFRHKSGLLLTDRGHVPTDSKLIRDYGKFDAAGLINHIHLNEILPNRVAQFEIGVRAIRSWIPQLSALKGPREILIYLNGPRDYTLCLYSDPPLDERLALDKRLTMTSDGLTVMQGTKFLRWAIGTKVRKLTTAAKRPR